MIFRSCSLKEKEFGKLKQNFDKTRHELAQKDSALYDKSQEVRSLASLKEEIESLKEFVKFFCFDVLIFFEYLEKIAD